MKWWVYTDGLVCGPYAPETLARRPSFTRESLVCPDGEADGRWMTAGSVGALRAVIEGRPFPPDPTLDDVADHRRLAERLSELESAARRQAADMKDFRVRESLLKAEISRKELALRELDRRLAKASSQLAAVGALEDGLRAVMDGLRRHESAGSALQTQMIQLSAQMQGDLSRADKAAVDTARRAAEAVEQARQVVVTSLETAEKALAAAEEVRKKAEAQAEKARREALEAAQRRIKAAMPKSKGGRRPRPPMPPGELGLPEATAIDPPTF